MLLHILQAYAPCTGRRYGVFLQSGRNAMALKLGYHWLYTHLQGLSMGKIVTTWRMEVEQLLSADKKARLPSPATMNRAFEAFKNATQPSFTYKDPVSGDTVDGPCPICRKYPVLTMFDATAIDFNASKVCVLHCAMMSWQWCSHWFICCLVIMIMCTAYRMLVGYHMYSYWSICLHIGTYWYIYAVFTTYALLLALQVKYTFTSPDDGFLPKERGLPDDLLFPHRHIVPKRAHELLLVYANSSQQREFTQWAQLLSLVDPQDPAIFRELIAYFEAHHVRHCPTHWKPLLQR